MKIKAIRKQQKIKVIVQVLNENDEYVEVPENELDKLDIGKYNWSETTTYQEWHHYKKYNNVGKVNADCILYRIMFTVVEK